MLNRDAVFEALRSAIAVAGPSATVGVLMLRVRRREAGLLYGYDVAAASVDAIEAKVAAALRDRDQVWRVGDDAFVAVLPALRDRNHAALAAAKLVRVLQTPLKALDQLILPEFSIGISSGPDDADDPQTLCRYADLACGDADFSSDRFAFYRPLRASADVPHGDLRDALASNRLELFLQPIVDLGTGRLDRCEALARWTHPKLGPIAPDAFVRVAERTGLVGELTRWSLNIALRHAAEGGSMGNAAPTMSVNLAVDALQQPGFVEQVIDLLGFWGVPPAGLVLEVTESGLMRNPGQCARMLESLRGRGIGIAIDDFGTGYSSMAYLRRLPANELKIDKSFVRDMGHDVRARKLVASMIDLSHHLGMSTVAEGVEDAQTLALLQSLGCDHAQGFFIGKPAPAAQVMVTLAGRDALGGV